jgi:hypothetical protein
MVAANRPKVDPTFTTFDRHRDKRMRLHRILIGIVCMGFLAACSSSSPEE